MKKRGRKLKLKTNTRKHKNNSKTKVEKVRKVKKVKQSKQSFIKQLKALKTIKNVIIEPDKIIDKDKSKKAYVKQIESDILNDDLLIEEDKSDCNDMLEQIVFKIPNVAKPLIGTPKDVKIELDRIAKKIQKNPDSEESNFLFNKIHLYIHGYLINIVLKKFPFIKGSQTVDIYQEALIALRFKAIPNFKRGKGMSFLNFAKMCIQRHLITKLHASKNRVKDKTMNTAVPIDANFGSDDENNTLSNILKDENEVHDKVIESNESYQVTKKNLFKELSDFEKVVLNEYLTNSSYKDIAKNISRIMNKRYNTKSIDNALLRIRSKAIFLKSKCKVEDLPMFIEK